MHARFRQWWPAVKAAVAVTVVGLVGWQFARTLQSPELWRQALHPRPEWLAAAAVFYLLGLGFSAWFWSKLLRNYGENPPMTAVLRAYYVGHLGKYVPGKALAVLIRVSLIHADGVRTGDAALTAAYETLTTMASGALVAVVLLSVYALDEADRWKAGILLVVAGVPILPGVFNRIVDRLTALARRIAGQTGDKVEAVLLPRLSARMLLVGLAQTSCSWAFLGLSLCAVMQAMLPEPPEWSFDVWGRRTAYVALAYVVGFLALFAPGGLGVRELLLQQLLAAEFAQGMPPGQAEPLAVVVTLVLRLLWTAAEVIMAGSMTLLRSVAKR